MNEGIFIDSQQKIELEQKRKNDCYQKAKREKMLTKSKNKF